MKYIILTLNNPERDSYRAAIRDTMAEHEEIFVRNVNGKKTSDLNDAIDKWAIPINFNVWRPGEGGVWYSNIYAWEYIASQKEDVVVFEDDALLHPDFIRVLDNVSVCPDADFVTYYVPYYTGGQTNATTKLIPTYQQHGMVCMRYTPKGAKNILRLLEQNGLDWPVDIWLFKQAIEFETLYGYSPREMDQHIVTVDYVPPSNIHEDDRVAVHQPEEK